LRREEDLEDTRQERRHLIETNEAVAVKVCRARPSDQKTAPDTPRGQRHSP
jgi:hypothetical protein